jgi:hypothetical protein
MYFITFLKATGEVVDYRHDTSVPAYWTEATLKSAVSKDREVAENDIETLSFDVLPDGDSSFFGPLTLKQHVYDVATGKLKNNPSYVAPPVERRWTVNEVTPHLTLGEKAKFINNLTPTVVTAKEELKMPRNLADTTEILQFLVDSGDISVDSMRKILA